MKNIKVIVEILPLKKILLVFTTSVFLIACSTPKYTYYFNTYPVQNKASVKMNEANDVESLPANKDATIGSGSFVIQKEALIASTSKDAVVLTNTEVFVADKISNTSLQTIAVTKKNELEKKPQALKKRQLTTEDGTKNGNKKKNGIAIIGFTLSLVGLLLFVLTPFALLLSAFGGLFSLIGIKSEKRKLAVAGLIIGFVGFGLGLLFYHTPNGDG